MSKMIFFWLAFMLCLEISGLAQSKYPISIELLDESIQFPNNVPWGGGINPGIQLGTHLAFNGSNQKFIGIGIALGGYFHRGSAQTRFLEISGIYRLSWGRFFVEPGMGIAGILHRFPAPVYTIESGVPTERSGKWRLNPMPRIGVKVGYRVHKEHLNSLFVQYRAGVQLGFSDPVPVLPITLMSLGAELYFNSIK